MKIRLVRVDMDAEQIIRNHGLEKGGAVQTFIDNEVLKRCSPYVPWDTGMLNRSGTMHTDIGSGKVVYNTPYARRWYYEPAKFHGAPRRGNYWFHRMLDEGGRVAILRGAAKIARAKAR